MLQANFDLEPLLAKIDDLGEAIKAGIRPAAFSGSDLLYKTVKERALSVGGSRQLQASVYQKFVINNAAGANGDTATYHISWRKQRAKTNVKSAPSPDAGLPYSTIGFWIEFGRWQRYMVRTDKDGEWFTVVRPEMKGKPVPGRNASQAEKDAYWMPRKGGPVFHGPKSFLRSSYESHKALAVKATQDRVKELIREALRS